MMLLARTDSLAHDVICSRFMSARNHTLHGTVSIRVDYRNVFDATLFVANTPIEQFAHHLPRGRHVRERCVRDFMAIHTKIDDA